MPVSSVSGVVLNLLSELVQMTSFEIITIVLAIYAAVLSTVLMVNELLAEKEKLK